MTKTPYKPHIFVQYSVADIRESLTDCESDYPYLRDLTDSQLDRVLCHCWRKGYTFWNSDQETDLEELQRLAKDIKAKGTPKK